MFGSAGERANGMWEDAPAMTRILLVMYPLSWFLTMIMEDFMAVLFYFTPSSLFDQWRFWTIVTSSFVQFPSGSPLMDMIVLVFVMMILGQELPQREKVMGSTLMLWWLSVIGVSIRVCFLVLTFVVGKVMVLMGAGEMHWYGPYVGAGCTGLWPMYLVFISLKSYSDPTGSSSFWGVVQIPNMYYPLAIYAFFSLLSGTFFRPELLAGVVVGYVYVHGHIPLDRALPSRNTVARMEDSAWRTCCQRCCLPPDGSGCVALGAKYIFISEALDIPGRSYASLDDVGLGGARTFQMQNRGGDRGDDSGGGSRWGGFGGSASGGGGGGGSSFEAFQGSGQRLGGTGSGGGGSSYNPVAV